MTKKLLDAGAALAMLRENALRLTGLAGGAPSEQFHCAPGAGEWSPNEILAHMRACADVWGGSIARILAEDHARFAGTNPRSWMKRTDYLQWRFEEALRAFASQRRELLDALAALAPDEWERRATVTAWGQANERTLRSYASQLALHERTHVGQIEASLKALGGEPGGLLRSR